MIHRKIFFVLFILPKILFPQEFLQNQYPFFFETDTNYYQQHLVFNEQATNLKMYVNSKEKVSKSFNKKLNNVDSNSRWQYLISPNLNFSSTANSNKSFNYSEFNGLSFVINFDKKLSFDWIGGFYSANPQEDIKERYYKSDVLLGYGKSKIYQNSIFGINHFFDLQYYPDSIFTFSFARKSVKYGLGYNSLLLDDKTSPYTQLSASAKIWHLKYKIALSWLKEKEVYPSISNFQRKYMVNHLLSWNISKRINFIFFETVIWQTFDSTGYRGFDVNYLNPIIFYRPVEFAIGSPDNVLFGLGLNFRLFKQTYLYSQLLLDEFILSHVKAQTGWWGNKQAIQMGMKSNHFLGINNLFFLGEINIVRPFVYSHNSALRVYGQKYQYLGYSLGSNTLEALNIVSYNYRNWNFSIESSYRIFAEDSVEGESLGNNPYLSYENRTREEGYYLFQGKKYSQLLIIPKIRYLLIPVWNLNLFTTFNYSIVSYSFMKKKSYFVSLGISTSIQFENIQNLWKKL